VIEPYVSIRANPVTDSFCLEGLRRAARSLERACRCGRDAAAREDMSLASLMGGLALANAGLGVVHGFAAPVGGMFPAPHGAVCAALLAPGIEANILALRKREPGSPALARYGTIAAELSGDAAARPEEAAAFLRGLCRRLSIAPLREYGVTRGHVPELIDRASAASSMKGNPIALTREELESVILSAI
jgi:alcohol dehydrogenase class IV